MSTSQAADLRGMLDQVNQEIALLETALPSCGTAEARVRTAGDIASAKHEKALLQAELKQFEAAAVA